MRTIEQVVEELRNKGYSKSDWDVKNFQSILFPLLDEILDTYEAEQRSKGKWILADEESNTWKCTHCIELGKDDWWQLNSGTPKDNKMDFCPHCGADMREVEE